MASPNSTWQIYVNGSAVAHTKFDINTIGTAAGFNALNVGQAIMTLSPGDVVTLRNVCGSTNGVVANGVTINASLSIVKIV